MRLGKVVIPARMDSSRLPGKLMIEINNMPVIEHVWRRANLVVSSSEIVITTDSEVIANHMMGIGAAVHMSKHHHESGTSRVGEFMESNEELGFVVVLQGDEVLIKPKDLRELYEFMQSNGELGFVNTISQIKDLRDLNDLSVVKCTINADRKIMFMFRNNPFRNSEDSISHAYAVNGLFGLSRAALGIAIDSFDSLAKTESIEQLAFLSLGNSIFALETNEHLTSVNTFEDLEKVRMILANSSEQQSILRQYIS